MKFGKFFALLLVAVFFVYGNCFAMKFSQPVYIGHSGSINYVAQDKHYKGGVFIRGANYNDGNILRETGNPDIGSEYGSGIAIWGNGKNALYCKYECYDWYDNSVIARFNKQKLSFGGKNQYVLSEKNEWQDILKIESDENITFYLIYHQYKWWVSFNIIGCKKDGSWVKYIDSETILNKYFGNTVTFQWGIGVETLDLRKGISCKDNNIIVKYYQLYNKDTSGEFRFKWDGAAQWFSVEQIKY